MKIKRHRARDMRDALRRIREDQGPDAVILSTRQTGEGLEVISAVDFDETLIDLAVGRSESAPSTPDDESGGTDTAPAAADEQFRQDRGRNLTRFLQRRKSSGQAPAPESGSDRPGEAAAGHDKEVDRDAGAAGSALQETADRLPDPHDDQEDSPPAQPQQDDAMRCEINALRRMLESQLSALAWHGFARESPARGALLRDLIELGLDREQSRKLAAEVSTRIDDLAHGWGQALGLIAQRIAVTEADPLEQGGVIALVGPTGAGKTATIAKLAARHSMLHGPEQVAMISADDFRIGAREQLFAWGRVLNVPVFAASSHEELVRIIRRLEQHRLILVDTPGVGRSNQLLARVRGMISGNGRGLRSLLVLPANAQRASLLDAVSNFRPCNLAGLIITKLDEAARLGGVLGVLLESGWPVAFTCDGQEVPENLRRASARNLVRRAAELMQPDAPAARGALDLQPSWQAGREYAFG